MLFGINCYLPASGYCFIKCIKKLTGRDNKQKLLDFIRNEKKRSNILTKARFQPFCIAHIIYIGYFNGKEVYLRSVIKENRAFYS